MMKTLLRQIGKVQKEIELAFGKLENKSAFARSMYREIIHCALSGQSTARYTCTAGVFRELRQELINSKFQYHTEFDGPNYIIIINW